MGSFSHAGVSKLNGKFKVRFANDAMRCKVLIKSGHTDIDIIELKHPMTKEEAVAYLLGMNFDNGNAEVRAALEAEAEKRGVLNGEVKAANKEQKKTKEAKKPKKAPAKKASMDSIKEKAKAVVTAPTVDVAAVEDAPF